MSFEELYDALDTINQPDKIFSQPKDIADEIFHIANQERSAWSFDVEIRPDIEEW